MTKMVPSNVSKETLLNIIEDIKQRIEANDSYEGNLIWSIPEEENSKHPFDVMATYRIGNSMGQGGMRAIGEWRKNAGTTNSESQNL